MRARSASRFTASMKSSVSYSRTNVKTSPPLWQPKQWKVCLRGLTWKLGVRSRWKGQSAVKLTPARFRGTTAEMTSTMSLAARICSSVAAETNPAIGHEVNLFHDRINILFATTCHRRAAFRRATLGRLDHLLLQILFDELTGVRLIKDALLQRPKRRERDRSEIVRLHFRGGGAFRIGNVFRVDKREGKDQDAKAAH